MPSISTQSSRLGHPVLIDVPVSRVVARRHRYHFAGCSQEWGRAYAGLQRPRRLLSCRLPGSRAGCCRHYAAAKALGSRLTMVEKEVRRLAAKWSQGTTAKSPPATSSART